MPGQVIAIYIAPAQGAPMNAVDEVLALAGRGLEGDHHLVAAGTRPRKPREGRNVTLIGEESYAHLRSVGLELRQDESRRNLVTRGVDLNGLVGWEFRVGGVVLRGMRPCDPCRVLEARTKPGVMDALDARGGLRCDIVEGGTIRIGDTIEPITTFELPALTTTPGEGVRR